MMVSEIKSVMVSEIISKSSSNTSFTFLIKFLRQERLNTLLADVQVTSACGMTST